METLSDNFKKIFLISFTEELIKNSGKAEIRKLQSIINLKEKSRIQPKEELEETPQEESLELKPLMTQKTVPVKQVKKTIQVQEVAKPTLFIPEPKLPEHLEYLKPTPTPGMEIDLGKLNPLIKDKAVKTIEVNPDEKVIVTGRMGTKSTSITLNKEEIDQIINEFSKRAKIPIEEGIYRVVVGELILSAIISEIIGSKFMIKKMPSQVPRPPVAPMRGPPIQQPRMNMVPVTQRNDKMFPPKPMINPPFPQNRS